MGREYSRPLWIARVLSRRGTWFSPVSSAAVTDGRGARAQVGHHLSAERFPVPLALARLEHRPPTGQPVLDRVAQRQSAPPPPLPSRRLRIGRPYWVERVRTASLHVTGHL